MDDTHTHNDDTFEGERAGLPWKLIGLLIIVVVLATFFFQNGQQVEVSFLWFDGSWPLLMIIGICVALGVVLDRLATWQWRRVRSRRAAGP